MSLRRIDYAPSKKPYAIDWSTFVTKSRKIDRSDGTRHVSWSASVHAVWVGRKDGLTYVSSGELWDSGALTRASEATSTEPTIESFSEHFDPRYGGRAEARWNGHDLWAPGWTMRQMNDEATRLEQVLESLPEVPAGHEGWYALK